MNFSCSDTHNHDFSSHQKTKLESNKAEAIVSNNNIKTTGKVMKVRNAPSLRCGIVLVSLLLASVSSAQEVVVEEFMTGTTISSASVNSNFTKLADKANDNGSRISSMEGSISSINATQSGYLTWSGYTAAPATALSFYELSYHCKSEFGPTSFVASDLDLEVVIRTSADFTPPAEFAHLFVIGKTENGTGSSVSNYYFTGSPLTRGGGNSVLNSSVRIIDVTPLFDRYPVACVSFN